MGKSGRLGNAAPGRISGGKSMVSVAWERVGRRASFGRMSEADSNCLRIDSGLISLVG
jgi:hypothetical protein